MTAPRCHLHTSHMGACCIYPLTVWMVYCMLKQCNSTCLIGYSYRHSSYHLAQHASCSKQCTDKRRCNIDYEIGDLVLLSSRDLRLQGPRKLQDRFIGPFVITEKIGKTAYRLDLTGGYLRHALQEIHNIFHVALFSPYCKNRIQANTTPIIVYENKEHEIEKILQHRELRGKTQFLV